MNKRWIKKLKWIMGSGIMVFGWIMNKLSHYDMENSQEMNWIRMNENWREKFNSVSGWMKWKYTNELKIHEGIENTRMKCKYTNELKIYEWIENTWMNRKYINELKMNELKIQKWIENTWMSNWTCTWRGLCRWWE